MSKLIIFDLDGVLVDTKEIHYEALNHSLKKIDKRFVINFEEHLKIYDALPTKQKLELLTKYKNLPTSHYQQIYHDKQIRTLEILKKRVKKDKQLIDFFKKLKKQKYNIAVASNSIKETLNLILKKLGIYDLVDYNVSNEDVHSPKPHPEMFWKCMIFFKSLPNETTIIEDSPQGRNAAQLSGANVLAVNSRKDINKNFIDKFFKEKIYS
jgi:HAD superfamily hydrolase (TIGR01509 family)